MKESIASAGGGGEFLGDEGSPRYAPTTGLFPLNDIPVILGSNSFFFLECADIRDTVNYKEVMKQYKLGPNGGIVTALNLFATRFDQVMGFIEKRAPQCK